jgi:hypothetical protein
MISIVNVLLDNESKRIYQERRYHFSLLWLYEALRKTEVEPAINDAVLCNQPSEQE